MDRKRPRRAPDRRTAETRTPDGRSATRFGLAIIAGFAVALAWIAFRFHPVGDYFTESDFYGGYAAGARGLQHGHLDLARYGVYGPLYELALAAAGWAFRDLFVAARALSVASALVVMTCTWWWARRRFGALAAVWLVALLAVNPSFMRYGYSAGTDMLSCAWFAVALALLLGTRDRWSAPAGGIATGLATLTRYNLASLLPGALVVWFARRPSATGARGAAGFALAFALVVGAFAIPAARSGWLPGGTLVRDARFYLEDSPAQALEHRYGELGDAPGTPTEPPPAASAEAARAPLPGRLAGRMITGTVTHLRDEAERMLGWPIATLVLAGLVWAIAARRARPLLPLAPPFLATFVSLAPIYYSERYTLPLLPLELAPAALALGILTARRGPWRVLAIAAGVAALWAGAQVSVELQRLEYVSIPTETLAAGRAIRSEAHPGDRVLARKGHVAFAAGIEPVLFPDVRTLRELGDFCRVRRVRYLYYSWYELRLRPEFGYLIDTMATVPGLTPIQATAYKPSATYRVSAALGETPTWWSDASAREAIRARVNASIAAAAAMTPR